MTTETMDIKVHRIYKVDSDTPLKAFVDILINDSIVIKGLKLMDGQSGPSIMMPQEKAKDGSRWYDRVYCMDNMVKDQIKETVLSAYSQS